MTKIRSTTKKSTLLYLFIYYMNIQNVSSSRLYNRLYDGFYITGCKVQTDFENQAT